jgi:carbon-monoxide dehydrogenase iron sulfur subunit
MRRVYVREEACMGCGLCEVYCRGQHSQSHDLLKAVKKEFPPPSSRVRVERREPVFFPVRCQHCSEAPCVYACLTGALSRDPVSGAVNIDEEKCIGCWTCLLVCPLGAIRRDIMEARAVKCDLCQGEDVPVCVANCPNEALVYAEVPDMVLSQALG